MQNLDAQTQAALLATRMDLNDVPDKILRTKTLQVLLVVPTVDVRTAFDYLISTDCNVEEASWRILEEQLQQGHRNLQLNGLLDLSTRLRVERLQTTHPQNSTQECYVAVTIAKGVLDDAMKHLQWMQKQKHERGSEGLLGFLVIPDWTADAKPEW